MTISDHVLATIRAAVETLRAEGLVVWLEEDLDPRGKITVQVYFTPERQKPPRKAQDGQEAASRVDPV